MNHSLKLSLLGIAILLFSNMLAELQNDLVIVGYGLGIAGLVLCLIAFFIKK